MALTRAEWQRKLHVHGHRCYYCGELRFDLIQEHMHPRCQGGTDDATNIVPACPPCNIAKGGMTPAAFAALLDPGPSALPSGDEQADWMTVEQAAAVIGCDPSHVRRLRRDGVLPGMRAGKRLILLDAKKVQQYKEKTQEHGGWPRGRPRKPAPPADGADAG